MRKHRVTAYGICLVMILELIICAPIQVFGGDVSYTRAKPEVPILNAVTGNSQAFYDSNVKKNGGRFNAIVKFGDSVNGYLKYNDTKKSGTYKWGGYAESNLSKIAESGQLMTGISATFNNKWHTHSWKAGFRKQSVLSYSGVVYEKGERWIRSYYGSSEMYMEKPRLGDLAYAPLPRGASDDLLSLTIKSSKVKYDGGNKTCKCDKSSVTNMAVTFYDGTAPKLRSLGGNIKGGKFKPGDEITVELTFDEPIRFADDSANHSDAFIRLKLQGVDQTQWPEASLKSLNGKVLKFSYKIPEDYDKVQTVTGLDLSPLNIETTLKLVKGDGNFSISAPSQAQTNGYTTAASLITDIAGNAMVASDCPVTAYLDGQKPFVTVIAKNAFTNNAYAKAALGKTDPADANYLDSSDSYLGNGDIVNFMARFNEKLSWAIDPHPSYGEYTEATATTNLKDGDGTISIPAVYYRTLKTENEQYGLGASNGYVTQLHFQTLQITPEMKCLDEDGKIRITGITFTAPEDAVDANGNQYSPKNLSSENTNPLLLDVTAPEVTTSITKEGETYPPMVLNTDGMEGFVFPFEVTDAESGAIGLYGRFTWKDNAGAGKSATEFEWAVSTSDSAPESDSEAWKEGLTGVTYSFVQNPQNYLFVRLKDGVTYDLEDTALLLNVTDMAGNFSSWLNYELEYSKDGIKPVVAAGTMRRVMDSGQGRLTATITAQDKSGLKSIQYQWTEKNALSADPEGWSYVTGSFTDNPTEGSGTASFDAPTGQLTEKALWARAEDKNGNISEAENLGVYSYDLTEAEYDIEYTEDVTKEPIVTLTAMGEDDKLMCLLRTSDMAADCWFMGTISSVPSENSNILNAALTGAYVEMSYESASGQYTLTVNGEPPSDVLKLKEDLRKNDFYGELQVCILAGKKAAFGELSEGKYVLNPVQREDLTLRTTGDLHKDEGPYDAVISITEPRVDVTPTSVAGDWENFGTSDREKRVLSTVDGLELNLTLTRTDNLNWGLDDMVMDPDKAFLRITNGADKDKTKQFDIPLQPLMAQTITLTQEVTDAVGSGWYKMSVHMEDKAGTAHVYDINEPTLSGEAVKILVDATPASSDFGYTQVENELYNKNRYGFADESVTYSLMADGANVGTDGKGQVKEERQIQYFPLYMESEDPTGFFRTYLYWSVNDHTGSSMGVSEENAGVQMVKFSNITDGAGVNELWTPLTSSVKGTDFELKGVASVGDIAGNTTTKDYNHTMAMAVNTTNVVTMQVFNANGEVSEVKTLYLYPVWNPVKGTFDSERVGEDGAPSNAMYAKETRLVFKLEEGQGPNGLDVFVRPDADGADAIKMDLQADGTYTCDGTAANAYYIYTKDSKGYYTFLKAHEVSTQFGTAIWKDDKGPVLSGGNIAGESRSPDYTFTFDVLEDTFYDGTAGELELRFDDATESAWGIPAGETLTVPMKTVLNEDRSWGTEAKKEAGGYSTEWVYNAQDGSADWIWTLTAESSSLGIREVVFHFESQFGNPYEEKRATVTVKATAPFNPLESATTKDVSLCAIATDGFGNVSNELKVDGTVNNITPAAVDAEYRDDSTDTDNDRKLTMEFNTPVRIESSWICPDPSGLSESKTDEIPVTGDGSHAVSFYDVFGNLWTQDYDFNDVFGAYSIDLGITPETLTGEAVEISAMTAAETTETADPVLLMCLWNQAENQPAQWVGSENPQQRLKTKNFETAENGLIRVYIYSNDWDDERAEFEGTYFIGDKLDIHVNNIGVEAPDADLRFYLKATGAEYTAETLPNRNSDGSYSELSTDGGVEVWYKTSRHVSAVNGTESRHTFEYDQQAAGTYAYTFQYQDDLGNEKSLNVDLADYRITFSEPPEPPQDLTAPELGLDIYAKWGGTYTRAESLSTSMDAKDISDALEAVGYVQGYSFQLDITDESECKAVILENPPVSPLTYDSAVSDVIDGVSLSGGNVTVTKAGTFTVAAVDHASLTGATDLFTYITLVVGEKMDNTAPTAKVEYVWPSLYIKDAYISFLDKDDYGKDTDAATLLAPSLEQVTAPAADPADPHFGWYKYRFLENGKLQLSFQDGARNLGTAEILAEGIDSAKPTLSAEWTPHFSYTYIDPAGDQVIDEPGMPPAPPMDPVREQITVRVTSDKGIADAKYRYAMGEFLDINSIEWKDTAAAAGIADTDLEIRQGAENITIAFNRDEIFVQVTVTAPNGKTAVGEYGLEKGVVDKTAPVVSVSRTPVTRTGMTAPIAYDIQLTPNEPSYCMRGGEAGKLYDSTKPVTVRVDANGTYTWSFVDKVGNTGTATAVIKDIDTQAPVLTMVPTEEEVAAMDGISGSLSVSIEADEDVTLTWLTETESLRAGTPHSVSLTQNGMYTFTAKDKAGNQSEKTVVIGSIDNEKPVIGFLTQTVTIRQGSSSADLKSLLDDSGGYSVQDNITAAQELVVTYDDTAVELNTVGIYKVTYTVTDKAGNNATAIRFVRVYDKNQPEISVDGIKTEADGLTSLTAGVHTMSVKGLKELTAGEQEPYTVALRKGIYSAGQMKGNRNTIAVSGTGEFTLSSAGYYTLYLVTQSRQTYRTLLYVER